MSKRYARRFFEFLRGSVNVCARPKRVGDVQTSFSVVRLIVANQHISIRGQIQRCDWINSKNLLSVPRIKFHGMRICSQSKPRNAVFHRAHQTAEFLQMKRGSAAADPHPSVLLRVALVKKKSACQRYTRAYRPKLPWGQAARTQGFIGCKIWGLGFWVA